MICQFSAIYVYLTRMEIIAIDNAQISIMRELLFFTLIFSFIHTGCYAKLERGGLEDIICSKAIYLKTSSDLDDLIGVCSRSKLVLLGESTHGTSEYYYWRAEISKRLIAEEGFNFIVVEGDWASIYRLNLYVKGVSDEYKTARDVMKTFNRWPEWMWANTEVEKLVEWLKIFNSKLPLEKKVGFYGMDVYGQWEAMEEVLRVAEAKFPESLSEILERYGCYTAFGFDEWQYALSVQRGHPPCTDNLQWVVDVIREHLESSTDPNDIKALSHAKQSAKVVLNSEDYYRLAVRSNVSSWNSRVMHMHETVTRLLAAHGEDSKGIVWAHNTHIGDARATSMLKEGMVNIGQLSRELHTDDEVTLIGFSTYRGRVNAGSRWGENMLRMRIPAAPQGSAEEILKRCGRDVFYTIFDDDLRSNSELLKPIGHRAIGVVYNPSGDHLYNYVPTILPIRYDAIIFIKITSPLDTF